MKQSASEFAREERLQELSNEEDRNTEAEEIDLTDLDFLRDDELKGMSFEQFCKCEKHFLSGFYQESGLDECRQDLVEIFAFFRIRTVEDARKAGENIGRSTATVMKMYAEGIYAKQSTVPN
jgi:hypothetical protein